MNAAVITLAARILCEKRGLDPEKTVEFQAQFGPQLATNQYLVEGELEAFAKRLEAIEEAREQIFGTQLEAHQ